MNNQSSSLYNRQSKDKQFQAQLIKVFSALKVKPMTMKELDVCTGIMRENICWYIKTLLEQGLVAVVRQRKCRITGFPCVNEYTSNQNLFPKSNQLKLF